MKNNIHYSTGVDKNGKLISVKSTDIDFNTRGSSRSRSKIAFGILGVILLLLLTVAIFRTLNNASGNLTFSGFLDWIGNYKPTFEKVFFESHKIIESWGLFEGLKTFINWFIEIGDFLLYICKSLVNLISYIVGFFQFLFSA